MGKYDKLVEDHLNARKDKDSVKSNVLGVLRGAVENTIKGAEDVANKDVIVEAHAKSMTKGLETVGDEQSKMEIEILKAYAPQTLSEDQIKAELDTLDLGSKPNVGAKMGVAMKHLKGRADGNDVKNVVMKYYN